MAQSLKFTLEVRGLDIPERAQAVISKALNQTLMQKLGELDLASAAPQQNQQAPISGSFVINKYLINGGIILQLINQDLLKVVRQVQLQNNIPDTKGALQLSIPQ